MKILWLAWKDKKHPLAGGAEIVTEELAKRLVQNGHKVILLTSQFSGSKSEEAVDNYKIIRMGGRWTVYWRVFQYYKKNLQSWADLVIDEVNTIPFFAKFYCRERNIIFIHQLCREVWFYQLFFPFNIIGYFLEPVYLRSLSDRKAITISESTKKDLVKYGFKEANIKIISEGIEIEPAEDITKIKKLENFTILSFGSVRAMKRTHHIIKAFEIAKEKIAELKLVVAGNFDGEYGRKILMQGKRSKYNLSIEFVGKLSIYKKIELLQQSHLLCAVSVKEGWGLVVTEANSQGTPAVVYNVDGLRDAVRHDETGIICAKNTPQNLAENIIKFYTDKNKYEKLRYNAWIWSKSINFEKSYEGFIKALQDNH